MNAEVTPLFLTPEVGMSLRPTGTEGGALRMVQDRPILCVVPSMAEALRPVEEEPREVRSFGTLVELVINQADVRTETDELAQFRDIVPVPFAVNVESDPRLKSVADHAGARGRNTLNIRQEINDQLIREDRLDEIPDPVDAMGTAYKLDAVRQQFGKDSPEYRTVHQALWWDKYRRVCEAWDHNGKVVFDEELIQELDPVTNQLFADGLSVDEMLDNALIPTVTEEEDLRINNFKNNAVIKAMIKDPANEGKAIIQVWQCPDYAQDAYKHNPNAAPHGYAPKVAKYMIVRTRFLGDNKIGWKQLGVPGTWHTPEVIDIGLKLIGALKEQRAMTKTETHGAQAKVSAEVTEFDIVRIFDEVASRLHGIDIFMGNPMPSGQERDYEREREGASQGRQQKIDITNQLVNYVEMLAEQGIGSKRGTALEDKFLQNELLEVAKYDLNRAVIMFDEKTAQGFREVQILREANNHEAADIREAQVKQEAPAPGGCGAGSCGMERVNLSTSEGQKIKALLDVQDGEEVLHDTERACPECGKMSVYYAYTETYVKKACADCGATDFKETAQPGPDTRTKRVFTIFDHETKTTQKIYETRGGFRRSITSKENDE